MKNFLQKIKYLFNKNYISTPVSPLVNNSQSEVKEKAGEKEKVIVRALFLIFLVVLIGASWDLYGKNILLNARNTTLSTSPQITTAPTMTTPTATAPTTKNQKTGNDKQADQSGNKVDSSVSYSSYSQCIENTKDLGSSKDCCDCMAADEPVRKACRDFAATYDYSKNTTFKTFEVPSKLGRTGDYSSCTASGDQNQCKQCCESSNTGLACGDYQYCRTACNNLSQ